MDLEDLREPIPLPEGIIEIRRPRLCGRNKVRKIPIVRTNKYQRLSEIHNVIGFVVNVHDPTNFDIDLELPIDIANKYDDVISNTYTYQQLPINFSEGDLNDIYSSPYLIGKTYRCRLRGVGINQLPPSINSWKTNEMCNEIKKIIDQTDGWVICNISDIDVYQRLLIDIIVPTQKRNVNLKDYLLQQAEMDEDPLFYPYTGRKK